MTDEEIRIKVAETMGWDKIYKGPEPDNRWLSPCGSYRTLEEIPNYLNDLNACAEFEAMLNSVERFTYLVELNKLCGDEPSAVWATARQRCIAFLKTKGILP